MNANDILLRRRNPQNNGWEDVLVPVAKLQVLGFNALEQPTAGSTSVAITGTALATNGAGTYLAAALLNGIILRDCAGANRTDTTDTRANILTAFNAVGLLTNDYDEVVVTVVNTSDQAETITIAGGTNVTVKGTITIAQNEMTKLAIYRTSSTTLVLREV